jgi:hypothetical protein
MLAAVVIVVLYRLGPRRPFLHGLHLVEQCIEAQEVALPEFGVALEPFVRGFERLGLEPAGAALRVAPARDEASALENLDVLGDRGLAHRERLGELGHGGLAGGEPRKDRPPRRIGERDEGGVEAVGGDHSIACWLYNEMVMDYGVPRVKPLCMTRGMGECAP